MEKINEDFRIEKTSGMIQMGRVEENTLKDTGKDTQTHNNITREGLQ